MFGKKKKLIEEQEKTIAELNGRLKEQQLQMEGLNSQLDEYKKREYAISRAITDAIVHRKISDVSFALPKRRAFCCA